ncbi:MAG: hypothetical protein H7222_17735 [Methylotenera sp.]|nr:hypothetical protein [Oligoflexia bacterium]
MEKSNKVRFLLCTLAWGSLLSSPLLNSAHAATLVYTNDVLGEIEPCGCRSNPQGGMLRKSHLLEKLRQTDSSLLQLDAGDLLFDNLKLPEILQKQSEVQAGFLLKSMDLVHHDAVVPGEKDFALGVKTFEKLTAASKIQFLAANLKKKNGKAFLKSSALFTLTENEHPLKIAVIGLVGETLEWPRELKASSPITVAKALVPALRKKADLVIALTHQGYEADKALAKAVPGIDMIVGGHTQSFLQTPEKVGNTLIYQSSFRNQYVGVQPLHSLRSKGSTVATPAASDAASKTKAALEKQLLDEHRLVGLDPAYEPKEGTPDPMRDLVADSKREIAQVNSQTELKMVRESTPPQTSDRQLQTFPRCAECHLKQFDFWRRTDHAQALQPLILAKQAQNLDCLSCHTVGLGQPSGFSHVNQLAELQPLTPTAPGTPDSQKPRPYSMDDLGPFLKAMHEAKSLEAPVKLTRDSKSLPLKGSLNQINRSFTPVQCENCHTAGGEHPFSGTYTREVKAESCLKCHTPERAPGWYLPSGKLDVEKVAQKRLSITCPAGDLAPSDN